MLCFAKSGSCFLIRLYVFMLKKLFLSIIVFGVLGCLAAAGGLYWLVVANPGSEIEPENIRQILGKESHVFYSDGHTKLGVFFDQNHRQYVKYDKIPSDFVNALVAAEDNLFFSHFGFDPVGITRAAIKNFQAGRVVQGGSTLTQQTAKNLFKRTDRSLQAKLKELLFALRLEYWYTKEQIFEFYANQFYVSGNGHGLGVAARYYFNKKPQDLSLLECAFIAGSVKKPNAYNPFIKKSDEAARAAEEKGRIRANYVLKNMYESDMIGLGRYREELRKPIVYNKGDVGYELDYTMDLVKDAVGSQEVIDALDLHGISNVATSGINIITSVDKDVQQYSLMKLREELSRLDIRLRGYEREEVQQELRQLKYRGDRKIKEGAFLFGTVDSINRDVKNPEIIVSFGRKLGIGKVEKQGVQRALNAYAKWKKNAWAESTSDDLKSLLSNIRAGDRIWASVISVDGDTVLLNLEKYPQVQGGALVLDEGAIKAVVGGTENRFFNRAIDAKRTMGSSFKPFLFAAAIQLGWNPVDVLINKRDVFVFQNQPYFPRPDHKIKSEEVSMSWVGVHSENVASIWLTTHLCDRLNIDQFREVAEYLGLAPRVVDGEKEPYRTFKARIRDRYGIVVNRDTLRHAAYYQAVKNVETDFIFEGMDDQYEALRNMHYGLNFGTFSEQVENELADESKKLSKSQKSELRLRLKLLSKNFLALEESYRELEVFKSSLMDPLSYFSVEQSDEPKEQAKLYFDFDLNSYTFTKASKVTENMQKVDRHRLQEYLLNQTPANNKLFWDRVRLNSTISVGALKLVQAQLDREYGNLEKGLPYSFETLAKVQDFRTMVGLHYLIAFAKELGVKSKMEPVLSFALGSNVTSLLETVRIYEGLATGEVNFIGNNAEGESRASLAIIDRIESAEGRLLYKPVHEKKRIIDKRTSLEVGHILENIVKFGTGRYADKNVKLQPVGGNDADSFEGFEVNMPLLGKTGTANRYTNASFFGYLPQLSEDGEGVDVKGGYAVGVYVGYDNNKSMRKGTTRIAGSGGALPTWTGIVNTLIAKEKYGKSLDPVDLSFTGLPLSRDDEGQINLKVDKDNGGKVVFPLENISASGRYTPSILTFGTISKQKNGLVEERHFEPFWRVNPMTVE